MGTGSSASSPPRRERARPRVSVLRVGHRAGRDPRLTTHVALVARALGAGRLFLHPPDPVIADRIARVNAVWGGDFAVLGASRWPEVVREFPGPSVHLTMYGEPWARVRPRLRAASDVLLIVGGAKVPAALYRLAHHNASIGAQPHSEVGALAVALVDLLGHPRARSWPGARQQIVPRPRGKEVRLVTARAPT